ncbi:MAG: lipoate--protein ligase [Candidatus Auribacterota bacterium]|jgi:lipoate-protein ligase A|nr:lipoate--protein ligase [Candidatus Auribacterota bacterium]
MHTRIIRSTSTDPCFNLALEEWFFYGMPPGECVLLLYVNRPAVVIGKNQNPWSECDIPAMQIDEVHLCRRISGGGAVYHDMGNLNFSFLSDRNNYDIDRQLGIVLNALSAMGFDVTLNNRRDLTLRYRKISGNAFCLRKDRALHHGTLLVDSDTMAMNRYLRPVLPDITTRSVASNRSEVINLVEVDPRVTLESIIESLCRSFNHTFRTQSVPVYFDQSALSVENRGAVDDLYRKNSSLEWVYGRTPQFGTVLSGTNI